MLTRPAVAARGCWDGEPVMIFRNGNCRVSARETRGPAQFPAIFVRLIRICRGNIIFRNAELAKHRFRMKLQGSLRFDSTSGSCLPQR